LFIIFFGDLLTRLRKLIGIERIGVFADDLVVHAQTEQELKGLIDIIEQWAKINKCEINTEKTKILEI
jgi:hypothetical protein